ncbi:MAG: DUF4199 domain-containing protein [Flavobacterium sp.]|nr:DUF4199 domain-containing protein [Flavobacterium sp.]
MKKFSIEIKWAILFTIVSLLWFVGEKITGLHDIHINNQPFYALLFALPALIIYILALLDKKKKIFNGQMTWTQGFISGTFLALFITMLNPLMQYLCYEIISPNFFRLSISYKIAHKVSVENAETYYNMKNTIFRGIMDCMSYGIITSAIIALFVKTKEAPSNEK